MSDPALRLLAQQQLRVEGPQLLLADENLNDAPLSLLQREQLTIVTNRFDLCQRAEAEGFDCRFSDFALDTFADGSFSQVLFRVAKEKAVAHHIINQSRRLLCDRGTLAIAGAKGDGIKTYTEKAGRYLGDPRKAEKHGNEYLAVLHKLASGEPPLDDQDYPQLRPCIDADGLRLQSKPGQFGWNKVDPGSALLAAHLRDFFSRFRTPPATILDLGCGYGYLSAMAARLSTASLVATDNNAAAILSCQQNFAALGIPGRVVAGDCGSTVAETFDAVICNPPFHQGFSTDSDLTRRFAASCRRHLKPHGKGLFVVNRFVPLEQCAEREGLLTEMLAENRSFKLLVLGPPSRR
ncbi:class I SAM-dependent methyltransferase [Porticoccus sp.]